MSAQRALAEVRAAGEFLADLRPFLHRRLTSGEANETLRRQLALRTQTFVNVLRRAVFSADASPYRRLFERAGVTFDRVVALLEAHGLEGTLARLHDDGVYLTLEEFKGFKPIVRPGLEMEVAAEDFDNPLSPRQYETCTGGSSGKPRRILVSLDLIRHESAHHAGFITSRKVTGRDMGMWLPAPPGAVAIKNALIRAKLGQPISRWFSQSRANDAPARHRAFAGATSLVASLSGFRIPGPEYTPARHVHHVTDWLSERNAVGTPALMFTTPSAAVRVCADAMSRGVSIRGSLFVLVGEPYTAAKAQVIQSAGCQAASHYAMVESGLIGLACGHPSMPDDVHLVSDKIATFGHERTLPGGARVTALYHTTLLPASPKLMINVESGDYGVLEERACGCGVLPDGFRRHLHTIRSYEKLTSEGTHFLGGDLLSLVEQVLPAAFGGNPTDYQFVEFEESGLSKVSLVVSPLIGDIDQRRVVRTMLEYLRRRGAGQHLMSEVWENCDTLRVVRRDPHVTPAAKIQPLHRFC